MKACNNCKSPFAQVQLSSIVRFYAILDVFRFLVLLGPMLSMFYACTNLYPTIPHKVLGGDKNERQLAEYILYNGNRKELSHAEQRMLDKGLHLQGIALILPVTSATCFLVFQKKDLVSTLIAVTHFSFEAISVVLGIYGSYFISDRRLCFLGHFSTSLHIPVLLWSLNIFFAIIYKIGIAYSVKLYLQNYCKSQTFVYHAPTPEEELKTYLEELKLLELTPKTKFDLPDEPNKRDWENCKANIKKILHDVRIQMAELHKDDPMVGILLRSGKLQSQELRSGRKKRSSPTSSNMGATGPSVLKIAKMMANRNTEYKLLKHHHHRDKNAESEAGRDDVEIILPGPKFRYDPDS